MNTNMSQLCDPKEEITDLFGSPVQLQHMSHTYYHTWTSILLAPMHNTASTQAKSFSLLIIDECNTFDGLLILRSLDPLNLSVH